MHSLNGILEVPKRKYDGLRPRHRVDGNRVHVTDMIVSFFGSSMGWLTIRKHYRMVKLASLTWDISSMSKSKSRSRFSTQTIAPAQPCKRGFVERLSDLVRFLIQSPDFSVLHTGDVRADSPFVARLRHNPTLQEYIEPGRRAERPSRLPNNQRLDRIYLDTSAL